MLNRSEILETIEMIDKEHFDVRTITMGLSLFSCIRQTAKETAKCVYDLICRRAEKIVRWERNWNGSTAFRSSTNAFRSPRPVF